MSFDTRWTMILGLIYLKNLDSMNRLIAMFQHLRRDHPIYKKSYIRRKDQSNVHQTVSAMRTKVIVYKLFVDIH